MAYNYREGKNRIIEILDNRLEVKEQDTIPDENSFTFDNAYYSWVTGLFVDIRNSATLFANGDKVKVSKIIRSFTSELIEILKDSKDLKEIGIRGDCVYGVYGTPYAENTFEILNKAFYANTYLKMLSALLNQRKFPIIYAGIGVSTAKELIVKAGRKNSGINNKVWIGKAVAKAAKLSSLGNKKGMRSIVISETTYKSSINILLKDSRQAEGWFNRHVDPDYYAFYDCGCIMAQFNKWIDAGMKT